MLSIAGLKTRICAIVNEYVQGTDDFATQTDAILEELIIEAAQEVVSVAPNYYCTMTTKESTKTVRRPDGLYVILIDIPDGMVRPVQITSTSLIKPIHDFLPVEDPRYAAQYSSTPGIGAGRYRPIAFVRGGQGAQIEAHSTLETSAKGTLYYVGKPTKSGDNLNVNDVLEPAISLKAAQLLLEAENSQAAQIVATHYKEAIQAWA